MATTPDSFPAIPILLERVTEDVDPAAGDPRVAPSPDTPVTQPAAIARVSVRVLPGREAQQSLFDEADLPPATAMPARRRKPAPSLQRLAEDLLRVRAPAIINELADEHARRLSAELAERLRRELARLLAELATQGSETTTPEAENLPPPDPQDNGTPSL
jgi:hypothetical protein